MIDTLNPGGAQLQVLNLLANCPSYVEPIVCVLGGQGHYSTRYGDVCAPVYLDRHKYDVRAVNDVRRVIDRTQPDVIHAHLHKSVVVGSVVGRLTHRPVLLHFHSSLAPVALNSVVPRCLGRFYRRLLVVAARNATKCIVVTQRAADQLIRSGVSQSRVVCIPNGIDLDVFAGMLTNRHLVRGLVRAQENAPDGATVVGMVARLSPVKGWHTFLAAAKELADEGLVYWAIGGGDIASWRSVSEAMGVSSAVRWLGQRDDVHRLLAAIDVLVLASRAESFGLVILEGWAAGVPVVATSTDGASELISHDANGLLVPVDRPRELADAIRTLIDNPAVRARLVHAGSERVTRYDAREVAGSIAREYQTLIPGGTRAGPDH